MHPAHWERGYLLQTLHRLRRAVEAPRNVIRAWEEETSRPIERIIVVPHRFLDDDPVRHSAILEEQRLCYGAQQADTTYR